MRIAALLYPGMTLLDLTGPAQAWSFVPDLQLHYVAASRGPVPTDCGLEVLATHSYAETWADPDVIFVGGAGAPTFRMTENAAALAYLADAGARAQWVTSVCTGALILGAAGLLRGYRAATHWAVRDRLEAFGAIASGARVCVDRNRLTGGGITAGIDFGLTLAGLWAGQETAELIALIMEYAPEPPHGVGRPELASEGLVGRALDLLRGSAAPEVSAAGGSLG